jgi:putative Mg2+ transporter-C (MgtC) family protein
MMELNPPTLAGWYDLDLLSRLGIAALIGLLLGLDREWTDHAAGLRTHGLICFSSATMTVAVFAVYFQLDGNQIDPLRLFEAIGAFVGIVAAGLIVFNKGEVKNLTTAAHILMTAVIGIACGAALWPLVAIATLISIVMLTGLGYLERHWFPSREEGPDGEV